MQVKCEEVLSLVEHGCNGPHIFVFEVHKSKIKRSFFPSTTSMGRCTLLFVVASHSGCYRYQSAHVYRTHLHTRACPYIRGEKTAAFHLSRWVNLFMYKGMPFWLVCLPSHQNKSRVRGAYWLLMHASLQWPLAVFFTHKGMPLYMSVPVYSD